MNGLADNPFSFKISKDDKIIISRRGKIVKILSGKNAYRFTSRIQAKNEESVQLELARVTGNYKRGNEKQPKK